MPLAVDVPDPRRNWFRPCGASSVVANANPMLSAAIFTKIQYGMRRSDGKVYCAPRNNFAKRYDPQPFHIDGAIANASIFGGLTASSLHTLAACTRVVVEAQGDLAILSGLGIDEVKLFNPVRPGDVLSVEACWSDLKRSRSKPDRGIAGLKCKVSNQRGEPVRS